MVPHGIEASLRGQLSVRRAVDSRTKARHQNSSFLGLGSPKTGGPPCVGAPYNDVIAITTRTWAPATTPASKWQQRQGCNRCNAQDIGGRPLMLCEESAVGTSKVRIWTVGSTGGK